MIEQTLMRLLADKIIDDFLCGTVSTHQGVGLCGERSTTGIAKPQRRK